ncbi:hypothetical protein O6H91_23G058100 [Diphasiastrum complanatum]|uniref:Uncharacterized protein n=1 Tax=Diphasiastrum complanatum TaxID=34168 RepID=A0ACC2AB79_DIPCM|nr:hypothetical protein O6H91_23G058100 [Diphasiastrum complanatum]
MNAMPEQIGSPQFRVTKIQHKRTEAQRSIDTLQGLKTKGVEEASCRLFEELEATTIGEDVSSGVTEADCPGQGKVSAQVEDYTGTKAGSGDGWVRCDDCRKWRCISTELADMIDTTAARWTCLDNPNKDFANCSVRQEKSNAQINAELELSDDTDDEEDEDKETAADSKSIEFFQGSQPTTWKLIRRNNFLHRQRKTHDNDDYVICHCKQPADGSPGCGDDCMNRMVSMECVPEICPCGEACSNQQFRKRMYANVALFRSGKKGFGLKALENVPKGSFITEYVGEVLDMPTFEARQKDYAQNGQKHFYFMTLNSSEVIDAYAKGNWGRFINHSCEPNCQTEKWCVNGEICIGLFAIRDLVQGEEITFDYHYEPVYGAAAKKCECGSSQCRGYIGGQPPLNPTSIVESESEEEEDPEPVMLEEESEDEVVNLEEKSVASAKRFHGGSEAALWEPRIARAGRLKRKRSFGSKPDELENSLKGSSESKRPKYSTFMRKYTGPKELLLEPNVGRQGWGRPSRSIQPSEVEGKLNELLDAHGGLEKRKDVAKQYMKLLVLSIASGETVHGGPSWSVRDLSLLLDAVLKTSSKSVLSDILQKNGLQLLHNLVKQSRRNWKKLPILRKLMKVLELLSLKKVLTDRHISCIPSRDGMESFMESIVQLTHHDDTEVYQIARRFKTKWFSVGAMYSHRSFGEKHSKSQNWHSHFQQPTSQQRILYGDSSSPPLPNESSGLRNISLKSLEKPASQSVHSGSFVSAERCSSVSMLHTATGILATSALIVEGERDHFESRKSHDSTLPNNCNINMVNERPSRDKRNSCWDQPAITDNVCSEHQQILAGDSEAGLGGNVGILEDVHQSPFSFVPSTGIRFNSCRQSSQGCNYYDQSPDGHQASARNEVARIESFQSLSDSPTIKIDSRARIKSGHTNHLRTQEHSKRPHRWFKGPNQPVRAKLSSQGSVMRSGALQTPSQGISSSAPRPGPYATSVHVQPQAMQARAPQGHPLMGMAPLQPYHQPPLPIGPFPGHQMSVHLSAPRGVAFSTPPRWQPGLQLPVLPSVPAASLSGPTQMPNGVSHNQPPRADSGNLQTTTGRGPGQVPLARAAFQSGLPATSPVFTNQGEFQSLQGSSARPHRAGYPFRSPEVFHCQGPPCVSENKLPMGRLGPSPTGASTYKRSDDGNRVPFVCRESMEGFEPEPPVPGL